MARVFPEMPNELAELVFEHLTGGQLLRLRCVSRAWAYHAPRCIRRFEWIPEAWRMPATLLRCMVRLEMFSTMSFPYLEARLSPHWTLQHVRRLDIARSRFRPFPNNTCSLRLPNLDTLRVFGNDHLPPNLAEVAPRLRVLVLHASYVPIQHLRCLTALHTLELRARHTRFSNDVVELPALRKLNVAGVFEQSAAITQFTTLTSVSMYLRSGSYPYTQSMDALDSMSSITKLSLDTERSAMVYIQNVFTHRDICTRLTHLTLFTGSGDLRLDTFPVLRNLRICATRLRITNVPRVPIPFLESLSVDADAFHWDASARLLRSLRVLRLYVNDRFEGRPELSNLPGHLDELVLEGLSDRHIRTTDQPMHMWPRPPRKVSRGRASTEYWDEEKKVYV